MDNLATTQLDHLLESQTTGAVEKEKSPIATALLGHFVEYYGLDKEEIKSKKVFQDQYLNNWNPNGAQ